MRSIGKRPSRVVALLAVAAGVLPGVAGAATFTYDFSSLPAGTVPAAGATPAGTESLQGTTTIGQVGADNWIYSGTSAPGIIRNDASPGMSGNYLSAYPTPATSATNAAPNSYDGLASRKNTAGGFNYSIPTGTAFSVSFVASIGAINYTNGSGAATTTTGRAQVALGYDQNGDGDVRGDAASAENVEWGPTFGIEPASGAGTTGLTARWYVRPPGLGTAVTANATGPGVYKIQFDIDPTTNFNAGSATIYPGFDGSGVLSVQQLFDANGAPVTDTLHSVLTVANLGLARMNNHATTNVGTVNGSNPAFWDGIFTRVSNNGAIDNLTITTAPEPTTLAALAGVAGLGVSRRRRR